MYNRYNDKELKVLFYTGRYKFTSYSQLIKLGVEKHRSNLSKLVGGLMKSRTPLLREIPHRPSHEKKFYLTKKGKEVLMELNGIAEEEIQFPKGIITTSTKDQKHRTWTINFQIEMDLASIGQGVEVLFCHRYFDTTGNTRDRDLKSKTAVFFEENRTLKADMIFLLQVAEGQQELYLWELENGRDSGKSMDKIIEHGKAILRGHVNEKYNFQGAFRSLWVFEHEGTMKAVLRRLKDNRFFANMKEYFLLKAQKDIGEDFFGGWRNLDGEERNMYYL